MIKQPRDIKTRGLTMLFKSNLASSLNNAGSEALNRYTKALLRACKPLIPYKTGALYKSIRKIKVGNSYQLITNKPYANLVYFRSKASGGQLRGGYWYNRAATINRTKLQNSASRAMREALKK